MKNKKKLPPNRLRMKDVVFHLLVIFFGLLMIYPLLWMLSASFKTNAEIFTGLNFLPQSPTLGNYIQGWKGVSGYNFGRFLGNSLFISVLCIVGNVISCSMAAFAFSKLKFKLNGILFSIMMLTLMLPFHVKLIPQYIVYNTVGWVNTFLPLVVPKFFATEGFFVFLLVQFMRAMSNELLEAPRIDGCNTFQIYTLFIMPLAVPALVTVAIFTFIWTWNDFFSQMIYLSDPAKFTVSLALRMFVDATGQSTWGGLFAMSCLSLAPLFVIFVGLQRYLIEGITAGSLKG
ncbi:MAG: carbohydrate ABC transporter permease [Treponema sp.]|jgi:multiple sugar transport system permease protein|nr:carbohydrate ABC transporter permease [Treponema sp.]